jgi:hypothetical protein
VKPLTERMIVATCVIVSIYLLWMLANLTAIPLVAGQMVVNNLNGQLQQCQAANQQLQGALREKPAEKK